MSEKKKNPSKAPSKVASKVSKVGPGSTASKSDREKVLQEKEETEKYWAKLLKSTDSQLVELQQKVGGVFNVFDQTGQKAVDVREVGTIVRALGMYPTEADIEKITEIVQSPNSKGLIKYERLVPYVMQLLLDGDAFPPISAEKLKLSFMVLDRERAGYFEMGRMKDIMMKEGEPFSLDEFDNMLRFISTEEEEEKFDWKVYMDKAGVGGTGMEEK